MLEAGIDLIQHPEVMTPRELPDDLVSTIVQRKVICSMLASTITGEAWTKHLSDKEAAQKKLKESTPKSLAEERRRAEVAGIAAVAYRRAREHLLRLAARAWRIELR